MFQHTFFFSFLKRWITKTEVSFATSNAVLLIAMFGLGLEMTYKIPKRVGGSKGGDFYFFKSQV